MGTDCANVEVNKEVEKSITRIMKDAEKHDIKCDSLDLSSKVQLDFTCKPQDGPVLVNKRVVKEAADETKYSGPTMLMEHDGKLIPVFPVKDATESTDPTTDASMLNKRVVRAAKKMSTNMAVHPDGDKRFPLYAITDVSPTTDPTTTTAGASLTSVTPAHLCQMIFIIL